MNAPDFSKYDETQLKQILSRIDRERFPERVTEIEARLKAFRLASNAESHTQKATGIEQKSGGIIKGGASTMSLGVLVFALLITLVAASFSIQRTSAAREK